MAGKPHEKTAEVERAVGALVLAGFSKVQIAECLDMTVDTLNKYYRDIWYKNTMLIKGMIAQTIYQKALEEKDTACLIYLCKTRLGWRETDVPEDKLREAPTFNFIVTPPGDRKPPQVNGHAKGLDA